MGKIEAKFRYFFKKVCSRSKKMFASLFSSKTFPPCFRLETFCFVYLWEKNSARIFSLKIKKNAPFLGPKTSALFVVYENSLPRFFWTKKQNLPWQNWLFFFQTSVVSATIGAANKNRKKLSAAKKPRKNIRPPKIKNRKNFRKLKKMQLAAARTLNY